MMAAHQFGQDEDDYDYDEDDEDGEEDDWGLSSSPSPPRLLPPAPPPPALPASAPTPSFMNLYQGYQRTPPEDVRLSSSRAFMLSSPQCSMDDDSTTDSEEEVAASQPVSRQQGRSASIKARNASTMAARKTSRQTQQQVARNTVSCASSEQHANDMDSGTTFRQRRAIIKELESKYHQECIARCRSLLALQRRWRQELDFPVPGLINYDFTQPEEDRQQAQSGIVAVSKSRASFGSPEVKHLSTSDFSNSLKGPSRASMRRKLAWRSNEREAIRRGILMFGVGRSEKVLGVMRSSLKHLQHGLGDIVDCCWEFVRACSAYAEPREAAYVEQLLEKAKDLGVETVPDVTERVGQWERIEKSGSVWLKRIRLLDNLCHAVRVCVNDDTQEAAYNAIDSLNDATIPCEWWNREADLALLGGVYKHGFGNYEAVRTDEQFAEAFGPSFEEKGFLQGFSSGHKGFGPESIDLEDDVDTRMTSRDGDSLWPDSNMLTRRLKRLVEHIARVGEQAVEAQRGSGRKVKQGQTWSKREKLNFLRLLLMWGLPMAPGPVYQVHWQFIKDQASVRPLKNKSDSSLEACYEGLIKEMTQLLEGVDSQEKGQQSGSLDNEGSSDGSAEKTNDFGEGGENGPAVLTHKTAVRLRERLELFDTVRQAVRVFPEEWRNMGLTIHQSHDLPTWWQAGIHDRQLVLGILQHGYGNWDAIFEDRSYNFHMEIRNALSSHDGENGSPGSMWDGHNSEETDEYSKGKGKRIFSPEQMSLALPSPKSCAKRLKFIGGVLRRQLQKHYNGRSKIH